MRSERLIVGVLIFAAGAACGTGITYYYLNKQFQKAVAEDHQNTIEWAKQRIGEEKQAVIQKYLESDDELDSTDPDQLLTMAKKYSEFLEGLGYSVDGPGDDPADAINPVEDETGIEVITSEDFTDTHGDYDKVPITYYQVDNVFVGAGDVVLDNADVFDAIGDILDHIKADENTPNIFVRNHDLMTDYDITMEPVAWGIPEED